MGLDQSGLFLASLTSHVVSSRAPVPLGNEPSAIDALESRDEIEVVISAQERSECWRQSAAIHRALDVYESVPVAVARAYDRAGIRR